MNFIFVMNVLMSFSFAFLTQLSLFSLTPSSGSSTYSLSCVLTTPPLISHVSFTLDHYFPLPCSSSSSPPFLSILPQGNSPSQHLVTSFGINARCQRGMGDSEVPRMDGQEIGYKIIPKKKGWRGKCQSGLYLTTSLMCFVLHSWFNLNLDCSTDKLCALPKFWIMLAVV